MLVACYFLFKFGINAHLADITELHRRRGDLEKDNVENLFSSYGSHVIMSRVVKDRIKSIVR